MNSERCKLYKTIWVLMKMIMKKKKKVKMMTMVVEFDFVFVLIGKSGRLIFVMGS